MNCCWRKQGAAVFKKAGAAVNKDELAWGQHEARQQESLQIPRWHQLPNLLCMKYGEGVGGSTPSSSLWRNRCGWKRWLTHRTESSPLWKVHTSFLQCMDVCVDPADWKECHFMHNWVQGCFFTVEKGGCECGTPGTEQRTLLALPCWILKVLMRTENWLFILDFTLARVDRLERLLHHWFLPVSMCRPVTIL